MGEAAHHSGLGLPDIIANHDDVERLKAASRQARTPCGSGSVAWRIWGAGGEPVLLLHGGSGSWFHWARNIAALVRAGHTVYVPDLPGFGESSVPPVGFDADAHTEWILSGMDQLLGASADYDVVGFSFGSMVATFVAVQNPSRVRRLVVVGAPALTTVAGPRVELQSWRSLPPGPQVRKALRHNLRAIMFAQDESIQDFVVDIYGADAQQDRIPNRQLYKTDILLRQMPLLRCPVWGIWGAQDALHLGCIETAIAGLSQAPRFQVMTLIPHAGHWVQFESPERFNQVLVQALRG